MDPISMALIAGGSSLLGNIFSSNTSAANTQANIAAQAQMQGETEQFNAQQAGINRQFQAQQVNQQDAFQQAMVANQQAYETQMSNTAYERSVNDMKRAGLNPMMMFGSGGPESTPSIAAPSGSSAGGSSASVGTPNMALNNRTSALAGVGGAVSSAIDAMSKYQGLAEQQADINYKYKLASTEASRKFGIELDNQKKAGAPGAGPTEAGVADVELAKARATDAKNVAQQADNEYKARSTPEGVLADQSRVFSGAVKNIGDAIVPWVNSATAFRNFLPQRSTSESTNSATGASTFTERYNGGMFGGLGYKPLGW